MNATTITHDPTKDYVRCQESEIPAGVRFDVPRFFQGQIIQVAYGGFDRTPHGPGSPYMYRLDQSTGIVEYYRLRNLEGEWFWAEHYREQAWRESFRRRLGKTL